jgi:hypothetical protein
MTTSLPCASAGKSGNGGGRVLARGQTGFGPRGTPPDVDLEPLHLREVEHDAPFRGAVPGGAVAAAADGELQPALSRERDDARDVGSVLGPDDGRRSAVDAAVEDLARLVVAYVLRRDHPPAQSGA